jgi:RimJ/RimL family protein N-acetyltransferase
MRIETPDLILRPAVPGDARVIAAFKRDPLVRKMALSGGPLATEEGERKDLESAAADEGQLYLLILLGDGERPIGYVRINWMERPRFAWLRFALGEQRGRGHMKAALRALLSRLFEEGLHRVDAEAYEENERSRRLMGSLGFVEEGRKREARFDGRRFTDVLAFGLLRRDFEGASH